MRSQSNVRALPPLLCEGNFAVKVRVVPPLLCEGNLGLQGKAVVRRPRFVVSSYFFDCFD